MFDKYYVIIFLIKLFKNKLKKRYKLIYNVLSLVYN